MTSFSEGLVESLTLTLDNAQVTWTPDGGPAAGGTLRGNRRLLATVERILLDSDPAPIPLPDGSVWELTADRSDVRDVRAAMWAAGAGRGVVT